MNNFSEIYDTHLFAGTGDLPGAGSWCGRLFSAASCSVALPRTMTLSHRLFPLSFPSSQPAMTRASGCEDIDPRPDFSGRTALEMLMGPEMIVDRSDMLQGSITRGGIVNGVLPKQPLHRADEPLDAAVLPGASRLAVLQTNPLEAQEQTKAARSEDGFVISTQPRRESIRPHHGRQLMPYRPCRLVRQPLQPQAGSARMIYDGQYDMPATVGIGLGQQVHAPDQIAGNGPGHSMFQCSSQAQDGVLLSSDRVGHVGFADGHFTTDRESPVEVVHDRAAACVGHEGFEPNELTTNPFRFGRRVRPTHRPLSSVAWPIGLRSWPNPTDQPSAQPDAPWNESAPQAQHRDPLLGLLLTDRMET